MRQYGISLFIFILCNYMSFNTYFIPTVAVLLFDPCKAKKTYQSMCKSKSQSTVKSLKLANYVKHVEFHQGSKAGNSGKISTFYSDSYTWHV